MTGDALRDAMVGRILAVVEQELARASGRLARDTEEFRADLGLAQANGHNTLRAGRTWSLAQDAMQLALLATKTDALRDLARVYQADEGGEAAR